MSENSVLAQLMTQGAAGGADIGTLRAIAEEASELGAARAMERLGLDDAGAARDMAALRELLSVWRDVKKSLWKAIVAWCVRTMLVLALAGIVVKLGHIGWMK